MKDKSSWKQVNIRMPAIVRRALRIEAVNRGVFLDDLVEELLSNALFVEYNMSRVLLSNDTVNRLGDNPEEKIKKILDKYSDEL